MAEFPTLAVMGGPSRFNTWRPGQVKFLDIALYGSGRFAGINAPTGTGKSNAAVGTALLSEGRTLILTSTKGLQDQYASQLEELTVDMRGRGNYPCRYLIDTPFSAKGGGHRSFQSYSNTTCDKGPCRVGLPCEWKQGGCSYFDQLGKARSSEIVVGNYSHWLSLGRVLLGSQEDQEERLGSFDTIILDEAHAAHDEIAKVMDIAIRNEELRELAVDEPSGLDFKQWKTWAERAYARVGAKLEAVKAEARMLGMRPDVVQKLWRFMILKSDLAILRMAEGSWIVLKTREGVEFKLVWAAPYAESLLYRGATKVVMMSATLSEKEMGLLGAGEGLGEDGGPVYVELPSTFPTRRCPVYLITDAPKCHWRMSEEDKSKWRGLIREIVDNHRDRAQIVHTVSYGRMKELQEKLGWEGALTHTSRTTREVVARYNRLADLDLNPLLLSPSLGTGYDFPYHQLENQVIAKVPYPDTSDPVTKARIEDDEEYGPHVAVKEMVQIAGRGMRAEDDQLSTWVTDVTAKFLLWRYQHLVPKSFRMRVRRVTRGRMPRPLKKLERRAV